MVALIRPQMIKHLILLFVDEEDLGGDAAAFVAPRNDLQGVKGND